MLFLTLTWEEECFLNPITTALRTVTNGYKRFHTRISPRVSPSSTCVHWSILYPLSGRLLGIAPGACAATLVVLSLVDIILLLSKLIRTWDFGGRLVQTWDPRNTAIPSTP